MNWSPVTWNGEKAFAIASGNWRAVVSVDRGRLVHFGPAASETNLLFAPADKDAAFAWGGHRVWLGPQNSWSAIWPPPPAWEVAAAERAQVEGARLELIVPDAGDGWPRITRVYEAVDGRLACTIRVTGGTRSVQVMQIFQTPTTTATDLRPAPSEKWPRGFVRIVVAGRETAQSVPDCPPHVTATATGVRLHYRGSSLKLGFPPQDIVATIVGHRLRVSAGTSTGTSAAAPDAGFFTQIYLGDKGSPVVELEQLSPLWTPGGAAAFGVSLGLDALP